METAQLFRLASASAAAATRRAASSVSVLRSGSCPAAVPEPEPAPRRPRICRQFPRVGFHRRACDRLLLIRAKPSTHDRHAAIRRVRQQHPEPLRRCHRLRRSRVVYRDSPFATPFVSSVSPAVQSSPRMWHEALEACVARLARTSIAVAARAQRLGAAAWQRLLRSASAGSRPRTVTDLDGQQHRAGVRGDRSRRSAASGTGALTGSRAFPRFTGPQIRKFWRDEPAAYARTHGFIW